PSHLRVLLDGPATTHLYTLSLHHALPISLEVTKLPEGGTLAPVANTVSNVVNIGSGSRSAPAKELSIVANDVIEIPLHGKIAARSEEHTSELQSRENLVCRLLLEKKDKAN